MAQAGGDSSFRAAPPAKCCPRPVGLGQDTALPHLLCNYVTDNRFSDVHPLLTPVTIITFGALRSSHKLLLWEHFRYLQHHHFIQSLLRSSATPYLLFVFESICRSRPHSTGIISLIYASIISSRKHPMRPFQQQWERELSVELESAVWQIMLQAASKSSRNVVTLENAYKVIYRWYYTPARLARIIPQ